MTSPATTCPLCGHYSHDGVYCGGWEDQDPSVEVYAEPCACSFPDPSNFGEVPDRKEPEDGTVDYWMAESGDRPRLINMPVLAIAHHHATGHDGGGGGFEYECNDCDFAIDDSRIIGGGWARFNADA